MHMYWYIHVCSVHMHDIVCVSVCVLEGLIYWEGGASIIYSV